MLSQRRFVHLPKVTASGETLTAHACVESPALTRMTDSPSCLPLMTAFWVIVPLISRGAPSADCACVP